MSKLQTAAIHLLHKLEKQSTANFINAWGDSGYENIDNAWQRSHNLWFWSCKRWPKTFPLEECRLRDD